MVNFRFGKVVRTKDHGGRKVVNTTTSALRNNKHDEKVIIAIISFFSIYKQYIFKRSLKGFRIKRTYGLTDHKEFNRLITKKN